MIMVRWVASGMVVYLDVQIALVIINFVFDWALLWSAAVAAGCRTSGRRLCCGALIGTIYYAAVILADWRLIPGYGYLRMPPCAVAIALAMLKTALVPRSGRQWRTAVICFYIIGFLGAGSGFAVVYTLNGPGGFLAAAGMVGAILAIILPAKRGWRLVKQIMLQRRTYLVVDISFGSLGRLRVMALHDTGNTLRHPLSGRPVVIVAQSAVNHLLPKSLANLAQRLEDGELECAAAGLEKSGWGERFTLIPYAGIGRAGGLIPGLRPDFVTIWWQGKPYPCQDCLLGLSSSELDKDGIYQALIGTDLLAWAEAGTAALAAVEERRELGHAAI